MWSLSLKKEVPWHRRLEAHVLFGVALVVLLTLMAVLWAAQKRVTAHSVQKSQEDLKAAQAAYYRLVRDRAGFASAQSRLITELPVFRAYLTNSEVAADVATVNGMAAHYREKLKANFCIVTDESGHWIGQAGWSSKAPPPDALLRGIQNALEGKSTQTVDLLDGSLYLVVTEPATFADEEVLGTLVSGYRLDDTTARELAGVTHCDINFLAGSQLLGSSLGAVRPRSLSDFEARSHATASLSETPSLLTFRGKTYIGGLYPLLPGDHRRASGQLLLLEDWESTRSFLNDLERTLYVIGGLAFAFALTGGWVMSHRIALPLQEVTIAIEEVAEGLWERQAPVAGSAETRILADSFNRMTAQLRHYHQESERQSEKLEDTLKRLQSSYSDTLNALSRALDARDNETDGHSQRVADYSVRIARKMGLDEAEIESLHLGALLHDIGKIGVPDAILHKPGKLDPEERAVMERHCEFGLAIVQGIAHLDKAAALIRYHHERFDGNGYPQGLAGKEIPLCARIFSVADTLDAITSDRPYRKARTFGDALEEIRRCSGTQFDPQVVEALLKLSADPKEAMSFFTRLNDLMLPRSLSSSEVDSRESQVSS